MDGDGAAHLMTVLVRNAARSMRRRHHRARAHEPLDGITEPSADSPNVDSLVASAEEHIALLGCVNQLAEIQRRVVTLRMLDEVTPSDTASSLGLTAGHIGVLLHRAKRELTECLERMQ
jgi:RNA polymerase sigma-70 factor (ECF subfamily)